MVKINAIKQSKWNNIIELDRLVVHHARPARNRQAIGGQFERLRR
jgi:hypothetical protein